jgi:hypothetical protein
MWILLCFPHAGNAQECGAAGYQQYLKEKYPELEIRRMAALDRQKNSGMADLLSDEIITIPVVVHIVFNNATENIPDDQVYDQLEVLNEDFRRFNQDLSTAPNVFRSVSADIGIQFCLASVDPNGDPTSGITRTATSHGSFDWPSTSAIDDDVKHAADGGVDAWDTEEYLNIWVCDISGSVRGYAPYPGTATASEDGVVIDFNNFGWVEAARGRTAAHEVGHWFNLIHIWGDADCGDDDVDDTPKAKDSNGGCPSFPLLSTGCNEDVNGEMFVNHMDYSDHTCRVMFTQGQRDRMLANFTPFGARFSLMDSDGCGANCPRARFVTADFDGETESFSANDFVIGWSKIEGGADIVFTAGDSVRLDPGFHAKPGNEFRAYIGGCSGARPADRTLANATAMATQTDKLTCFPNPFSQKATIRLTLGAAATVDVAVYDLTGRQIVVLAQQQYLEKGVFDYAINAANALLPGMYVVRLQTDTGLLISEKIAVQ